MPTKKKTKARKPYGADNSYAVDVVSASANGYYTPVQAKEAYGHYSRTGVTYHWWNRPTAIADSDHYNIVNMMKRNAEVGNAPTVNYVASMKALTLMIHPDNAAWCSNNGNASTISVEASPHLTDAFYRKLGWLHDQLEQRYNRQLAIYVHKDWVPTECSPIEKARIRTEADKWKAERNVPVPAPAPAPVPPTVTVQVTDITNKQVKTKRVTQLWDLGFTTYANAKPSNPVEFPNGYPAGHIIKDVSAIAKHPLGSSYYITEFSYAKGIKKGINVNDVDDYTDLITPPAPAPTPTPAPTPAPTPIPVPVPITPPEDDIKWIRRAIQAILDKLGIKI